jgi:GT2 family glycosyltransferase
VQAHHRLIPQPSHTDGGILFATANVAIRRRVFASIGGFGFPSKFHGAAEDTELASRLSLVGAAMIIDQQWCVRHDVGESLPGLCRRYWRYGYANGALLELTTAPVANQTLVAEVRASKLTSWVGNYRRMRAESERFSSWRLARATSAAIATIVRLSYLSGAAAAIRDAEGHRAV